MFKKKKENKIIKTDIWFQTTDPSINYIQYEGNYYYIKESYIRSLPYELISATESKTGVMCNMNITEMIKISEEFVPLIKKEKYYGLSNYSVAYIYN